MNILSQVKYSLSNSSDFQRSVTELESLKSDKTLDPYQKIIQFKGCGYYQNISAKQVDTEIDQLITIVSNHKPKTIVEIGTYRGGTLFIWCQIAPAAAHIISMDLDSHSLDNAYSQKRRNFYTHFARNTQQLDFIAGDSHAPATKQRLQKQLDGKPIDFLFIDGDHTYEGVKQDFEMYAPLVHKNGIIAFHDILPRDLPHVKVDQLWNEIKDEYQHKELIKKKGNHAKKIGIGVIWQK